MNFLIKWFNVKIYCSHPTEFVVGENSIYETWRACLRCQHHLGLENWFWKGRIYWRIKLWWITRV